MRTFAELLREYVERVGISDAELARALGVRRQTIFRWKEGLSERPRHREDVLGLAAKLRLAPEERDGLLLAAGFAPEQATFVPSPSEQAPETARARAVPRSTDFSRPAGDLTTKVVTTEEPAPIADRLTEPQAQPPKGRHRVRYLILAGLAAAGLLALAALYLLRRPDYPVANGNETLVLIGQFVNYGSSQQSYNVAGRLQAAVEQEIRTGGLQTVHAAVWPAEIRDEAAALAALDRSGAALVIWGEYDSGRVLCRFTGRQVTPPGPLEELLVSPADLPATINTALPDEVRGLALLALGQVALAQGRSDTAAALLAQAASRPASEADNGAALYFYLGRAYQSARPAELEKAIDAYTRALNFKPDLLAALNNRGLAYLRRSGPGDLALALADLDAAVAGAPDDASGYVNRAAAYLNRREAGDLDRARADLDRAVALAPASPEAYFNRGLIGLRRNDHAAWEADFTKTLELAPNHAAALAALCWGYALERQPGQALPYCNLAVETDPGGESRDSRGLVYAELGRLPEAAEDFNVYIAWLDANPGGSNALYAAERRTWVTALDAGRNPIDDPTLARLRNE